MKLIHSSNQAIKLGLFYVCLILALSDKIIPKVIAANKNIIRAVIRKGYRSVVSQNESDIEKIIFGLFIT